MPSLEDRDSEYEIEPSTTTDRRTCFIVNLKMGLIWLMADFSKHLPHSNTSPYLGQPSPSYQYEYQRGGPAGCVYGCTG
jgi:hypothetical protein